MRGNAEDAQGKRMTEGDWKQLRCGTPVVLQDWLAAGGVGVITRMKDAKCVWLPDKGVMLLPSCIGSSSMLARCIRRMTKEELAAWRYGTLLTTNRRKKSKREAKQ